MGRQTNTKFTSINMRTEIHAKIKELQHDLHKPMSYVVAEALAFWIKSGMPLMAEAEVAQYTQLRASRPALTPTPHNPEGDLKQLLKDSGAGALIDAIIAASLELANKK